MVLGGLLSVCNIYVGLKVGVAFNMSITAALLGYGFWGGLRVVAGGRIRSLGVLENNINQTACSSAASVSSAGLVAAIPALTLMTGQTLEWHYLALWVLSVMLVGIAVAIPLRRQMVVAQKLPFPAGIASAEMLRELHARGSEAIARVVALSSAAVFAGGFKLWVALIGVGSYGLPFSIRGYPARALTMTLSPSLLMVAIGGLIGLPICCSLLFGSIVAYGVISPALIEQGYVTSTVSDSGSVSIDSDGLKQWLLWPGVTMMVVASLVSLCLSWRSIIAVFQARTGATNAESGVSAGGEVPRRWFLLGLAGVLVLSVALQMAFFEIVWWSAILAVLLAFALAVVAARVAGETGVGTVGSMGKVAQLVFGFAAPSNPVPNLMAANVAGGAASQAADLLADLKCGHLLGAAPRLQTLAQICGALAGALVGSAVYLILIPDPAGMLQNEEWPAPSVAVWKTVAELFLKGFDALPPGIPTAMAVAAAVGAALPIVQQVVPRRFRPLVLSPVSIGLAFVIPASFAFSMFVGAVAALMLRRWFKDWSTRFLVAIWAGIIAGESLMGMGISFQQLLSR
jgi:putative OPT family oligopeptide transporter